MALFSMKSSSSRYIMILTIQVGLLGVETSSTLTSSMLSLCRNSTRMHHIICIGEAKVIFTSVSVSLFLVFNT